MVTIKVKRINKTNYIYLDIKAIHNNITREKKTILVKISDQQNILFQ